MDTFSIASELLQKEFKVLLSRSPLPIDTKRLVQIMALNMFVIEQTKVSTLMNNKDLFKDHGKASIKESSNDFVIHNNL